ncbi:hypothetical protein [Rhizobium leguminosarum]|uniref:hypothetical protein n=1 Tax=Rhizobium leguminosarum TaxID=384 RepID=UPI001C974C9A|nr:hypothetical protein [Rhizobium leguminosarum]MBY5737346.1 hypothetical protein [Rhizobium leguminosarum]
MTRTFEARKTIRGSFLLREETLRRIISHMTSSGGMLKATLTFKDERVIASDNIEEILTDSLISSTKIDQLRLRTIECPGGVAEVLFADRSAAMGYGIEGERTWVLALEQDILNEFNSGKLWFSNLNPNRWPVENINTAIVWISVLVGVFTLLMYHFGEWIFKNTPLWIPLSVATAFGLATLLQTYLFPSLHFGFGKGLESYRFRTGTIYFLFAGLFLSIVTGVVGNYFSLKLGIG